MEKGSFARPTADDRTWFERMLPEHPDVTSRPMFGNVAGFVNGNMFMGLYGSLLAVRLGEQDRAALLAEDGAEPFEPMAGRPMKEYVVLPPAWRADEERAHEWVRRALSYTSTLPPKQPKAPKKKQRA